MIFDDITFKNRNKDYGAFWIRKKYRKTLVISTIISISIVLILLTIQIVLDLKKQSTERLKIPPKIIAAELVRLNLEELKPKDIEPAIKNEEKIVTPLIRKDSIQVNDTTKIRKDTTIKETKEALVNENNENFDDAKFSCEGNMLDFRMWFMENFKYPDNPKIRKNEGRILFNFIVNTKGFIDSVWVVSGIDPIIDSEALRLLQTSPRFKPCIFRGKPIKQLYQFPVYLVKRK
jgi:periplasmic protein TonB